MKRVAILGATGSIGVQAREVIERHPDLELVAASSGSRPLDGVAPLTQVGGDPVELLEQAEPDVVLNAVVGFAGVRATLWTLERGIDLALANKESLVAAGELALAALERGGGRLLPVDSEHSALFQCLEGRAPETVDSVVLTASGGPFRGRNRSELEDVTPDDALAHPTWSMGPKITVDSATLANKGLEVIEAHFLFDLPYERIEVVIQPTSVVHALVRLRDGSSLAHVGYPDMRVPISYALTYPDRAAVDLPSSTSHPVSCSSSSRWTRSRSRCSAWPGSPASEEAATRARSTLRTRSPSPPSSTDACRSSGIPEVAERTLDAADGSPATDVESLHEADREARRLAEQALVAA